MPKNYFVDVRKKLKSQLLDFIKSHPDMSKTKTLALFSLSTGLKVSTIETYYQELYDAEQIIVVDD